MPAVDTAYIIGVIREQERGLLEEDEYTRLIGADDSAASVRVLADTPYGRFVRGGEGVGSLFDALTARLEALHSWLGDVLPDQRAWRFISARYDALNIVRALIAKNSEASLPEGLSRLGTIAPSTLESAFWHNLGWDRMPEFWERVSRELLEDHEAHTPLAISMLIAQREQTWREDIAFTPLMRRYNAWRSETAVAAASQRPLDATTDVGPLERQIDEALLALVKEYRFEPIGFDPILAYWFAVELEVKQLRLLFAARFNGMTDATAQELRRPLFRSL